MILKAMFLHFLWMPPELWEAENLIEQMPENYSSERQIFVQMHIIVDLHMLYQSRVRSSVKGGTAKRDYGSHVQKLIQIYTKREVRE